MTQPWNPGFGAGWLAKGAAPPAPPPAPPPVRLALEGPRIMLGATEFVPRGFVTGHAEIYRTGDHQVSADMGANFCREPIRWWGDYTTGFQVDSENDLDPGNISEPYFDKLAARIAEARAAGLRVLLFMDSNCGQGLGGDACKLNTVDDQDFFTPEGAGKRAKFIEAAVYAVTRFKGLIDLIEPLVEPLSPNANQAAVWAYQEEFALAVLAVDPAMIFLIGGYPAYQANQIGNAYKPAWRDPYHFMHGRTVLTGNFLSGVAINPSIRTSRVAIAVQARIDHDCPVLIQQVGTTTTDDPDDSQLDIMLGLLDDAANGPIGYSVWEQFSVFSGGYGIWSLNNTNDPNSARTLKAGRQAILQTHFEAPHA